MADKAVVTQTTLDAIGQAIIAKGGATAPMTPSQMPGAIATIPTGAPNRGGTPDEGWKNDGASHFWNYIEEDGGEFTINISKVAVAKCTIFWGDGTSQELSVKSYYPGNLTHVYAKSGTYRVDVVSDEGGSVTFGNGSVASISSVNYNSGSIDASIPYTHIELGENAYELGSYQLLTAMTNLRGFKSNCVGDVVNAIFKNCMSLMFVSFGEGWTGFNNLLSSNWCLVKNIKLPKSANNVDNAFYGCRGVEYVSFEEPSSVIELSGTFRNLYTLKRCDIPASVQTARSYAFNLQSVSGVEIHFHGTVPPTFADSSTIKLSASSKVFVPYSADHSVLAAYKAAPNLSVYADQIYEEEES